MNTRTSPGGLTIAISVSDSPDLPLLGMGNRHLHRAMNGMATYLLSYGYRLAYGGDLRRGGFTEELFEIASHYQADQPDSTPPVIDYLAWPVWIAIPRSELRDLADRLVGVAKIVCLTRDGSEVERLRYPRSSPTGPQVASALTAMRRRMLQDADARVVLGGKVINYQGRMPGVAEEALMSLQQREPLYLLGGFGGCARHIAQVMGLAEPICGSSLPSWEQLDAFRSYEDGVGDFNNGLDADENRTLAGTPYIQEAIALILRGLHRLARTALNKSHS